MDKDDYMCMLNAASEKKAKDELFEIPSDRLAAVQAFRKWVLEQKHIKCPTDTRFLLMFLRARKFSQLEARRLLENHLIKKAKMAHLCENLDPSDPEILNVLDRGSTFLLPGTDKDGRKIIFMKLGSESPDYIKKNKNAMFKTVSILLTYAFLDENIQVNGVTNILDLGGYGLGHHNAVSVSERKDFGEVWQKAYPARLKAVHLYNLGAMIEFFMGLMKILLTEKLQKRLHTHSDLETMYKLVPMEMFPEEYLPDDYEGPSAGTLKQLTDKLKEDITKPEVVKRIKYLTSSEHRLDQSQKPKDVEPQSSFRKLVVD